MSGQKKKSKALPNELLQSNRQYLYNNKYSEQKYMQKEDICPMTTRSYWKQAQGEIPDDKTLSLSTRDVIKTRMADDLILYCQ